MFEDKESSGVIEKREKGSEKYFIVDASVPIARLNEVLKANFSAEGYSSVAGLILKKMEEEAEKTGKPMFIPQDGESFEIDGFRFTITDADSKQIKKVKVEKIEQNGSKRNGKNEKEGDDS